MTGWTADQIPAQAGRLAVITGANSGLGRITALELARHGADVILAVRDKDKGEQAASWIRSQVPDVVLTVSALDLTSLSSVRRFAGTVATRDQPVDLLINNAGIMQTPQLRTEDGFELQLGTNHLAHFALTGLLLPLIRADAGSRVVTVSSVEHKNGHVNFEDLQMERGYRPRKAYQQSKMASTMFALELDRRLHAAGSAVISVLAHPGLSATNITATGPQGPRATIMRLAGLVSQPVERGALPQLYAATAPDVHGGQFFGPSGVGEARGDVTEVRAVPEAHDLEIARRLWSVSEELTAVTFPFVPARRE